MGLEALEGATVGTMVAAIIYSSFVFAAAESQTVMVVLGAPGTEEYGQQFVEWNQRWEQAAKQAEANFVSIGLTGDENESRELLKKLLAEKEEALDGVLWLVLIGHGTFNGQTAKFNLRGPDVTAQELGEWLKPLDKATIIVNCASASGPFINRLSGPNRVIVTATKSGHEHNFARFGDYISAAIIDENADLDKDEQTSLLEAFLSASKQVEDFYASESRLATEHALLDDNGDGLGTPATWFRGVHAVKAAKDGANLDGLRANQFHLVRSTRERDLQNDARTRRDELEIEIAQLRQRKAALGADQYYIQLEALLLELAQLYQRVETTPSNTNLRN